MRSFWRGFLDELAFGPLWLRRKHMDSITENNGKIRWVSAGILVVERPFYGAEKELIEQRDTARAELAASQAREKALRESLKETVEFGTELLVTAIIGNEATACQIAKIIEIATPNSAVGRAKNALTLPADDTALREMLVEAQEEMRERCAKVCDEVAAQYAVYRDHWSLRDACKRNADAIRALEVKP